MTKTRLLNNFLLPHWQNIEAQRIAYTDFFRDKQAEFARFQPKSGGWTATQVMAHLIDAESKSLLYLQKKCKGLDQLPNTGIAAQFKSWLLKRNLRADKRFGAPAVLDSMQVVPSLEEVTTQWAFSREQLHDFLSDFPAHARKKAVMRHPRIGYINLEQTLAFFGHHIYHHQYQLNRLWAAYERENND